MRNTHHLPQTEGITKDNRAKQSQDTRSRNCWLPGPLNTMENGARREAVRAPAPTGMRSGDSAVQRLARWLLFLQPPSHRGLVFPVCPSLMCAEPAASQEWPPAPRAPGVPHGSLCVPLQCLQKDVQPRVECGHGGPLTCRDTSRDLQWTPGTTDNAEPRELVFLHASPCDGAEFTEQAQWKTGNGNNENCNKTIATLGTDRVRGHSEYNRGDPNTGTETGCQPV